MVNNVILYDTKYLQLKSVKTECGNDWVYAHRPNVKDVVVILPIVDKTKVLFLIEARPPMKAEGIADYTIGFPAGLVGDERIGESVEDAIRSELLEETGLKADNISIVTRRVASSPGCVSEVVTIAIANINGYNIVSEPLSDNGVIQRRKLVPINEINMWLKQKEADGAVITSLALAALYYLGERI